MKPARRSPGTRCKLFALSLSIALAMSGVPLGAMAGKIDLVQRVLTGVNVRGGVLHPAPELPLEMKGLDLLDSGDTLLFSQSENSAKSEPPAQPVEPRTRATCVDFGRESVLGGDSLPRRQRFSRSVNGLGLGASLQAFSNQARCPLSL